jgi:hypothetical protein
VNGNAHHRGRREKPTLRTVCEVGTVMIGSLFFGFLCVLGVLSGEQPSQVYFNAENTLL